MAAALNGDLFGGAVLQVRRPTEPIIREALVEDGCRYWLKRAWGAGPCILWAMCNPSNANGQCDDPTMWRVMEFSMRWGFGSCVVINPVPLISSTPAAAMEWTARVESMDHSYEDPTWCQWNANITHCLEMIKAAEAHVAAWGNNIDPAFARGWLQCIAESDTPHDEPDGEPVEWICLGTTQSGAPKHPLARGKHRVPADFKPVAWRGSPTPTSIREAE